MCVCAYCCSTHVFKVLSDADCKINFQAESTTSRQKRNFKYQKCPKVCEVLARSKITHSSTPKPGLSYNICCVHLMVSWSDFGGILCRKVQKSSLVSRFGSWKNVFVSDVFSILDVCPTCGGGFLYTPCGFWPTLHNQEPKGLVNTHQKTKKTAVKKWTEELLNTVAAGNGSTKVRRFSSHVQTWHSWACSRQ